MLEQQNCRQPPHSWHFQQQSTGLLSGAAVLTHASLTSASTTPCELLLDTCVLHQRTYFLSSQAPNLLSLVDKELHCPYYAVPWSLDICSTAHPSTKWECTADHRRNAEWLHRVAECKESEVFGWSRISDNTGCRSRIFCPTPDVQLDDFLQHTPKTGIPVEMVQFLLKLL